MSEEKGKVTHLAHVGVAVRSISSLLPFLRDVLGMKEVPISDSDGAKIAGLAAGDTLVELLESEKPDSPIDRFVKKRGPGIHHICLAVDDLPGMLERCEAAGIRLIDRVPRMGAEGRLIAFIHPESTGGILIELSE